MFFWTLLAAVTLLAWRRGDRDARIASLICVAGAILTALVIGSTYKSLEVPVAAIDCAILLSFVVLALRSQRFWPLWLAGLQLTTTFGHVLRLLQPELLNVAYAAALKAWSYPILLIIAVGVLRTPLVERMRSGQPA